MIREKDFREIKNTDERLAIQWVGNNSEGQTMI